MTLTETPVRDPVGAPDLGADTDAVLRDVAGYTDEQIATVKSSNG
jgi:crotonobetainyl-CoA:carnitine CoA-transferase CaiB-like acyl-CoA transferase